MVMMMITMMAMMMMTMIVRSRYSCIGHGIDDDDDDECAPGTRHGIGRYTCPDGSDYLGEWKHDKRHGRGRQRAIELVQSLPGAPKEFCTYDGYVCACAAAAADVCVCARARESIPDETLAHAKHTIVYAGKLQGM